MFFVKVQKNFIFRALLDIKFLESLKILEGKKRLKDVDYEIQAARDSGDEYSAGLLKEARDRQDEIIVKQLLLKHVDGYTSEVLEKTLNL